MDVVAALLLPQNSYIAFVDKERAWAHLDIAGVCWNAKGNDTVPGGAVGFGVRTLLDIAQQE